MELIQLDIARTFPHLCIFQRVSFCIDYAVLVYFEHSHVYTCGNLPEVLANQYRPWQHQCPFSWAPLVAVDKDADRVVLVSQTVRATLTSRQLIRSMQSNSESPTSNAISQLWYWLPRIIGKSTASAYHPVAIL
jgi:hypothetical protein